MYICITSKHTIMQRMFIAETFYVTKDSLESDPVTWMASIETYAFSAEKAQKRLQGLTRLELLEANPFIANVALVEWSGEMNMQPYNDTVTLYNMMKKEDRHKVDGWKWQEEEWSYEQQKVMRILKGKDEPWDLTIREWNTILLALDYKIFKAPHPTDFFSTEYSIFNTVKS